MSYVIGISGKTGAGKSTLAQLLATNLKATLISWDDFDEVSLEPESYIYWYHQGADYAAFKRDALENVLKVLKVGKNIIHPVFNTQLTPTQYIVFDAPLGKLHQQTGSYIDTCVHLDVPLDVLLCRRILRDFAAESSTKEALLEELNFYSKHSRPLFLDHSLKENADLVIDGLLTPEIQLEQLKAFLNA